MGLIVSIYKPPGGGSSNGGLSSRVERVCIVNVPGPFEPSEGEPPVALVPGNVNGQVIAVPVRLMRKGEYIEQRYAVIDYATDVVYGLARPLDCAGPMYGGCYVGSSDARLGRSIAEMTNGGLRYCEGIVALHDRFEGAALNAAMD